MTRARVTHAHITNVRDDEEGYARRHARVAAATPTQPRRRHAAAATPPPPPRARAVGDDGGDDEREAGVRDDVHASETRARYKRAQ